MLPCDGVVLAGGASRRMGQSKAELIVSPGRTLLDHAVSVLEHTVDGVVFISRPHSYRTAGGRDLVDNQAFHGPLVGIAQALRHSQYGLVAVLAVDLPQVPSSLFVQLYDEWCLHPSAAVVYPRAGSNIQPLAALWHARALPAIEDALVEIRPLPVQMVVSRLSSQPIEVAEDLLTNINTPQDWARFRRAGFDV